MATTPVQARPHWTLRLAVGLAGLIATVGVLFRQAGVPRYRTVWAEDGQVFGQCASRIPRRRAASSTPKGTTIATWHLAIPCERITR